MYDEWALPLWCRLFGTWNLIWIPWVVGGGCWRLQQKLLPPALQVVVKLGKMQCKLGRQNTHLQSKSCTLPLEPEDFKKCSTFTLMVFVPGWCRTFSSFSNTTARRAVNKQRPIKYKNFNHQSGVQTWTNNHTENHTNQYATKTS